MTTGVAAAPPLPATGGLIGGLPAPAGPFPSAGPVMANTGAWGRTLVSGTNALMPLGMDVPALHAGPPPI